MPQKSSSNPEGCEPPKSLRARAEEMAAASSQDISQMSDDDVQALVHELQVHQIELEMQNEELRQAQFELAESRDRYSDLYEFAPVGYITLDGHGMILEANLTMGVLLATTGTKLIGSPMSHFVVRDDQDILYHHLQAVFSVKTKQVAELRMRRVDGSELWTHLESTVVDARRSKCRTVLIDISDLRWAQRQREEGAQRFRRLTEALTDYVFHVRFEGGSAVETVHGPNCEAVTGYAPHEFAENPMLWIAMVPEEDRCVVERQTACVLSGQAAEPIEHRICRKDGEIRWVTNTVSVQYDAKGRPIAYDGLLRDVTARKRAEAALQRLNEELEQHVDARTAELRRRTDQLAHQSAELERREHELRDSNEQMAAVFNAAVDAIITIDRQGVITGFNTATERMFGYAGNELNGRNVRMLMPQPFRDEHDGYLSRYLETGEARIIGIGREVTGLRKDGTTFPIDLSVSEVSHRGLFTGILRDISQRKEQEESLRSALELTERIVNTAQNIVLLLDPKGCIVRFNPYMEELCGWKLEEVRGKDWFATFLPKRDRMHVRELFKTALAGRRTRGHIIPIVSKEGREREIEWYDAPLTDSAGRLVGLLCTGQDVTGRRELEKQVSEISESEQRRIGQYLHDDTGQRLTALALMADTLVHDLKQLSTPANELAVKLATGLQETLGQVRKLSQGLIPVEISAEGLMHALQVLAERIDGLHEVVCEFHRDEPVPVRSNAVATHLYRIAQEAVTNALRHAGPSRIVMELNKLDNDIRLQIADDGRGIQTQTIEQGGMGLKIMTHRAQLLGGRLTIEPAEGGGTRVICLVKEDHARAK